MTLGLQSYHADPDDWLRRYAERQRREDERRARLEPIWQADRARLAACPMKAPNAGTGTLCGLCAGELPRSPTTGRVHPNRRWCSTECSDTYWNNHGWDAASRAALRRDGWRCRRCNAPGYGRSSDPTQHGRPFAELRPLEVNHRIPRNGGGYHEGCHNHQDNLETLCRPCHAAETAKQNRGRRLARGLRVLIGIRTGELEVRHLAPRKGRPLEARPEPIWAEYG